MSTLIVRLSLSSHPQEWQATSQINLVAQERASQTHHLLEKIIATAATAAGYDPRYNDNIDVFFSTTTDTILVEVKSCWDLNLHTQFRRGVSQLFEYKYVYSEELGDNVIPVLLLETRPVARNAWLLDYAKHIGIFVAWKKLSEECLESSMEIPATMDKLVRKC